MTLYYVRYQGGSIVDADNEEDAIAQVERVLLELNQRDLLELDATEVPVP